MTDSGNPSPTWRTPARAARVERTLAQRQPTLTAIMENVYDPHNVAAIMRSADAVGIMDVHLLYYIEQFPDFEKKGKQSSAGTKKWVNLPQHGAVAECFGALRQRGFKILVSKLDDEAVSLYDLDLTGPVALLLGNENRGASEEAAAAADGTYYIPMMGMVQSLNVSVAAAVSFYEALRQRRAAGLYDKPQLPSEEAAALRAHWLRR